MRFEDARFPVPWFGGIGYVRPLVMYLIIESVYMVRSQYLLKYFDPFYVNTWKF